MWLHAGRKCGTSGRHRRPRRMARFHSDDVQIVTPGGLPVTVPVETENHGVGGSTPPLATSITRG